MNDAQLHELLFEALETELGGVQIYGAAIKCAQNNEFREELEKYHEQTSHHVELVRGVLGAFELDPETETPGRRVVRHQGEVAGEGDGTCACRWSAGCSGTCRRRMRDARRDEGSPELGTSR